MDIATRIRDIIGVAAVGVAAIAIATIAASALALDSAPASAPTNAPTNAANRGNSSAPRYRSGPPSTDGIGTRYMGREIAPIMGWQGAEWLERVERSQEERTDLLMTELALTPGMHVADIGAGTGYISRRMAKL